MSFDSSPPVSPSLLSPDRDAPSHMRAIITLVTNDEFVPGAQLLAYSLKQVKTTLPLYIIITHEVSSASRVALAAYGYHLILVSPLPHGNSNTHVSTWQDVGYVKLRIWQLTQFEKLLYIDADCLVMKNVDHLLSDATLDVTFAAAPDTFPPDHFNAGVMLLKPNKHVFASMVRRMSFTPSYDGGDTGFLNQFFPNWFQAESTCSGQNEINVVAPPKDEIPAPTDMSSPASREALRESCKVYRTHFMRLSFGYNALRTMQWMTKKAPGYWKAIEPLHIVHYCSSPKPWEDLEQRRGGFLEQQWFELWDRFQKEEPSPATPAPESLPFLFAIDSLGALTLSTECLAQVVQGKMDPFQSLQTLLIANMHNMPAGEFDLRVGATSTETKSGEEKSVESAAAPTTMVGAAPSTGNVRPLHRRGVWVSEARENAFLSVCRSLLQACLLEAYPSLHPSARCVREREAIPKRIHLIWLGGALPSEFQEYVDSWSKFHPPEHGWEVRLWTDADISDAHFVPFCEQLTDPTSNYLSGHIRSLWTRCTNAAQKSDLLRLDLLWTFGGLYVDTDFECLASFAPFHSSGSVSSGEGGRGGGGGAGSWSQHVEFYTGLSNVGVVECNNGLIAARPRHPLLAQLIQAMEIPVPKGSGNNHTDTSSSSIGAHSTTSMTTSPHHTATQIIQSSGPGFFTQVCVKYVEEWIERHTAAGEVGCLPPVLFFPTQVFYPLPNSMRFLKEKEDKAHFLTPASFAVHHWACSWQPRSEGATSSPQPPAASQAKKSVADANSLVALAQSIQRMNDGAIAPVATSSSASSSSSTSTAPHAASSAAGGLDPKLLSKIAAFMK